MATLDDGVRRAERRLSPVQIVLAWLDEARRFPSLTTYARSTLDGPDPATQIPVSVRAATLSALRGKSGIEAVRALRAARNTALLAYELVLVLNTATHEFAALASLRMALVTELGRALVATAPKRPPADRPAGDVVLAHERWQAMARDLLDDLKVERSVRAELERRYLAGHSALFPDAELAWLELNELARGLRERMADIAASFPAWADAASPTPTWRDRLPKRSAELDDAVRLAAYVRLGDRERASAIAGRRLRSIIEPGNDDRGDVVDAMPGGRGAPDRDRPNHQPWRKRRRPMRKAMRSPTAGRNP